MGAKKQQTFAKLQRERRVKEKRQLKLEKKALRKLEGETDESLIVEGEADESLIGGEEDLPEVTEEAVPPAE
jgi:phage protein U